MSKKEFFEEEVCQICGHVPLEETDIDDCYFCSKCDSEWFHLCGNVMVIDTKWAVARIKELEGRK